MRNSYSVIGITAGLIFSSSLALAQVFPPRPDPQQGQQATPAPVPAPYHPGQLPGQPAIPPPFGGPPGVITTSIQFAEILGDRTKAFIHLGNMRSPFDTKFLLGRGMAGSIALEKSTQEAGNGENWFIHITGGSNPPIVETAGAEVRLQFGIPTLLFKTYYKDYTGGGDSALSDLVAKNVLADVFILPTLNGQLYPTFQSIRIAVTGAVTEAKKCTHYFNIIFPVNVCKAAAEYFMQIQPALENGIRDVLLQQQIRAQFEQQMYQFVRAQLLKNAGINPMSPAQVEIVEAEFRGTDYVVSYVIR